MKKKRNNQQQRQQQTARLLGLLQRQEYLQKHPQGYVAVRKVHQSKKVYRRRGKYAARLNE